MRTFTSLNDERQKGIPALSFILRWGYCHCMRLRAVIHNAEEGGFWAEVPALPGCMTQGDTREELEKNLYEAVEGWLAAGEA